MRKSQEDSGGGRGETVSDGWSQAGRTGEIEMVPRRFERELEEMEKATGDALRTNPLGRD